MHRFLLAAPFAVLAFAAPVSVSHAATVEECLQVVPEAAAAGMSLQLHNKVWEITDEAWSCKQVQ